MLWVPQKGRTRVITNLGIVGDDTPGTGVPSNATTLLDGAVTELISAASNDQDSWGIYVWIWGTGQSATAAQACLDILIGGATDDILIPALICGYNFRDDGAGYGYFFPLHIPQGKRIAAVLASVRTSITAQVVVHLYGGGVPPWRVGKRVTAIGTQIDNARGQAIVPSTFGDAASVTEMIASTAEDYFAFLPGFQPATDTTINGGHVNVGIGVGASVEDRIGTWQFRRTTRENAEGPLPPLPTFHDVPAGSRLTMLASNSISNDTAYDGLIYAVS